ncbi:MAG: Electron transport protein, containing 4Fe-4S binding domain [Deltaproteobacteria bacterium]|jgi:NAD-dependent dihydropyrimidine dehydrogenase PreA subunit|nr:Electron transport protein, containing 4Fe-4S binding domain [Deltaproteobacteria bacterium]
MGRKIIRNSERCAGCSLCVLACSAANFGVFSLGKSYVFLERDDRTQKFVLTVSEECTLCGECVRACNYGAVEYGDENPAR